MNQLSFRFVLINCITAVLLVFAAPTYIQLNREYSREGASLFLGLFLYLIVWGGLMCSILRSYDLAYHSNNKLTVFEQLFLFVIYFLGWASTSIFGAIAAMLMTKSDRAQMLLTIAITLPAFILLVLESHLLSNRPKYELHPLLAYVGKIGNSVYASVGITVCWTTVYIGEGISFQYSLSNFLFNTFMMLIFVFPFQRLFWYEVMSHSNEKVDQLKVIGAIVLVILCGLLPRYFY